MSYCLNVKLDIKPERREEFLECIQANQAGTLSKEPLAKYYIWGEESDNSNVFRFHEQYQGKAGFEAHTKQPHFAVWEKFAATDPFRTPPEVFFWEEHSGSSKGAAAPDASTRHYALNGKITVKPEHREGFIKAFSANRDGSLKESTVIDFTFGADASDPNVFHFFERYAGGREGLESHWKTDHFAEYKKIDDIDAFTHPPAVSFYHEVVPGSVEMKVSSKKSARFYAKSARAFLVGVEGGDGKAPREPVRALHISGLGDAIATASAAAATVEAEGLAKITKIETSYPEMKNAGGARGCARILISLEKK